MGGCKLLYFVKSKNGRILLFYGQYIHSFVIHKISRRGATAPLHPPLII